MKTDEERADLRKALVRRGYVRAGSTHDAGDGRYTEIWRDPADDEHEVVVHWGARAPRLPDQSGSLAASPGGFTSAYHRVSDDSVSGFGGHPTLASAKSEAMANMCSRDIDHAWVRDEAREIVWDSDD